MALQDGGFVDVRPADALKLLEEWEALGRYFSPIEVVSGVAQAALLKAARLALPRLIAAVRIAEEALRNSDCGCHHDVECYRDNPEFARRAMLAKITAE